MGARPTPRIVIPTDERTLAYVAGIVDGEGHIGASVALSRGSISPSINMRVVIVNTDRRLVDWLCETLACGSVAAIGKDERNSRWKIRYRWQIYGKNAREFLCAIKPWLVIKREQAELAIELSRRERRGVALTAETVERRSTLYGDLRRLTKRGRS